VSGQLGGAAGGLKLLENYIGKDLNKAETAKLIERQLQPTPHVALGRELQRSKAASAMIDISDGLSSDIHHICEQSGVGAELDASLLPIDINLKSTFDPDETLSLALNGGEDFEMLITVPEQNVNLLTMKDLTCIGVITSNINVVGLTNKGRRTELDSSGYRHF
jgi:thiamine-monophosphate kinase